MQDEVTELEDELVEVVMGGELSDCGGRIVCCKRVRGHFVHFVVLIGAPDLSDPSEKDTPARIPVPIINQTEPRPGTHIAATLLPGGPQTPAQPPTTVLFVRCRVYGWW